MPKALYTVHILHLFLVQNFTATSENAITYTVLMICSQGQNEPAIHHHMRKIFSFSNRERYGDVWIIIPPNGQFSPDPTEPLSVEHEPACWTRSTQFTDVYILVLIYLDFFIIQVELLSYWFVMFFAHYNIFVDI